MSRLFIFCLCAVTGLAACGSRIDSLPEGQERLVMVYSSKKPGRCDIAGPNITVVRKRVLRGEYIEATGDLSTSFIRCIGREGETLLSTTHRGFFTDGLVYASIFLDPVERAGAYQFFGRNDGTSDGNSDKFDVDGLLVFTES